MKNPEIRALCCKKERKKCLTDCNLKRFQLEYKPPFPNIDPSNLSFVRICVQGVLTGFYGTPIQLLYSVTITVTVSVSRTGWYINDLKYFETINLSKAATS